MMSIKALKGKRGLKSILTLLMCLAMMIGFMPKVDVQAYENDFDIISDTNVTEEQAKSWAKSKGATDTFINIAHIYFKYSDECGNVNPAIAYVQAAKETGFGNFDGVIDESYCNPCGLKTARGGDDSDSNAHMKFNCWDEGVQAHMDHLALYAGANGYPKIKTYDPRHFIAIKGTAKTINSLSSKWASSSTYGEELKDLYEDLLEYSEANSDDDFEDNSQSESDQSNTTTVDEDNYNDNQSDTTKSTGWSFINGKWYYHNSDDTKATGWIKSNNKWYYLNDNGEMATGWLFVNNTWYYLNNSGIMTTGWLNINDSWYYLKSSGAMATGWIKVDNSWYYLKSSGVMATGWIKYKGDSYYLEESSGEMVIDTIVDGYRINSDGKMSVSSDDINTVSEENNQLSDNSDVALDDNNEVSEDNDVSIDKSHKGKTIVVDPGHNYGGDYGAVKEINGVKYIESDLNMEVAAKLRDELESRGYKVIMTRAEDDKSTLDLRSSLANRVNIANSSGASFFISIHHNSAAETAKGVETYYSAHAKDAAYGASIDDERVEKSRKMAKTVNDSIAKKIGAVNRGAKDDSMSSLFVLRNTNMPAILIEVGFITNPEEAVRCADPKKQQMVAEAIADAVTANY